MTNCVLKATGKRDGERFVFVCENCGEEIRGKTKDRPPKAMCGKPGKPQPLRLPPPPLPISEIERRVSICEACPQYLPARKACTICKTCGSGMAIYQGLLKDATKQCPWPEPLGGSKWGDSFDPIKVAFLAPSTLLGGAERWIASLCRHFDPAIVWPQYIALTEPQNRSPVVEGWLPPHTRVVSAEVLPQIMDRVDVLIAWGAGDLAHRTKGAKCRIMEVQHGTMGFGDYQRRLAMSGIEAGAVLTAVGEACLDNFPEEYRDKVTVIQNGAEADRLQPIIGPTAKRKELGIKEGEKVCLFIGRIAKVKNLDGLAAAMDLLPGWRLVVAGPEYQKHHCLGSAIVLPAQEHLGDLLAAADVFCAPSHHEANSLALQEAMLAGVPVVATLYPAFQMLLGKHGDIAVGVEVNPRPESLAAAIVHAASQRAMADRAKEVAEREYTAEKMAGRWQSFIQGIANAPT